MYILTEDNVVFHPGDNLFEIMHDRKISVSELAAKTSTDENYIADILYGKADMNEEFAEKLYKFFGVSATFWMNLQKEYDKGCRMIREKDLRYQIIR